VQRRHRLALRRPEGPGPGGSHAAGGGGAVGRPRQRPEHAPDGGHRVVAQRRRQVPDQNRCQHRSEGCKSDSDGDKSS
jgi:hypothetical protein